MGDGGGVGGRFCHLRGKDGRGDLGRLGVQLGLRGTSSRQ